MCTLWAWGKTILTNPSDWPTRILRWGEMKQSVLTHRTTSLTLQLASNLQSLAIWDLLRQLSHSLCHGTNLNRPLCDYSLNLSHWVKKCSTLHKALLTIWRFFNICNKWRGFCIGLPLPLCFSTFEVFPMSLLYMLVADVAACSTNSVMSENLGSLTWWNQFMS